MKRIFIFIITLLLAAAVYADIESVTIKRGGSKVLKFDSVRKVDVSNKSLVSATVLSGTEIIIEGKRSGITTITIDGDKGKEVLKVNVKNPSSVEKMVEIDVQMLEIINTDDLNFGIDWPTLLNGSASAVDAAGNLSSLLHVKESNPNILSFGTFNRGAVNVMLDFLVKENYAKLLAKPKILTMSDHKARFLSGGEIPVALIGTDGAVDIEWKEYGVKLEIEPVIVRSNSIRATLKAEVSNLDYGNGVQVGQSGSIMPAIKTRWAETTISIGADDTIIIAGLIQNEEATVTSGVPILSDIPFLGELFKNTYKTNRKTELVIFVTPKIVTTGEI